MIQSPLSYGNTKPLIIPLWQTIFPISLTAIIKTNLIAAETEGILRVLFNLKEMPSRLRPPLKKFSCMITTIQEFFSVSWVLVEHLLIQCRRRHFGTHIASIDTSPASANNTAGAGENGMFFFKKLTYKAALAVSTSFAKASLSETASSASIFLFRVTPAFFKPFIN